MRKRRSCECVRGRGRSRRLALQFLLGGVMVAALAGCGGSASPPTSNPTPLPTATPAPTPTPTPTPAGGLPPGMTCNPTPPPLLYVAVKIHAGDSDRVILDTKPVVPNIDNYCDRVGFGSWKYCDTRPEGDPERVACDYLAIGKAADTGRWGPTWYYGNDLCSNQPTNCANHSVNQFFAVAKAKGVFEACAADDRPVAPNGYRCGQLVLK